MNKTARVLAALRGEDVDRVPVSAWWHDFPREWSAELPGRGHARALPQIRLGLHQGQPASLLLRGGLGRQVPAAGEGNKQPVMIEPGISAPEHLDRLQPLDVTKGAYGEQLESLRIIARDLDGEAPFIQTVFSPLAVMSRLTGSTKFVQRLMREEPDGLLRALGRRRANAGCIR